MTIALEVRELTFRYPGGGDVLRDVNFRIGTGERVALVGPSGAGKSTLLYHLNGLLPERLPSSPNVWVAEQPIVATQLPRIRRQVGFVFQDPDDQLFCPTVFDDVAFGPQQLGLNGEQLHQRVRDALHRVGLPDLIHRGTSQLSYGERKRICLAGVLACEPDILVLDEPFSNLDPRARRQLLTLLQEFPGTLVVASHDLDLLADLCQRVLILDAGTLQADGETRTVLSNPELMDRHGLEVPWRFRAG